MKKQICALALIVGSVLSGSSAIAASDWEWQVPPATGNDLLGITYTGSAFFAVGRAGDIVTSTTGGLGSWTHIPSPGIPAPVQKQYDFLGVASHGNTIVAVASTPSNTMTPAGYVVTSTDGGMTWKVAFTAVDRLIGVTYSSASNQFIAVGGGDKAGGLIYHSTDGNTNWLQVGTAISGVEFDAVASNGKEIAAVGRNGAVYMSLDQAALAFTSQTLTFDTTHTDNDTMGRDMHAIVGNPTNRDFYAVGENSALLHFAPGATPGMGTWTAFQLTSNNVSTPQPKINGSLRAIAHQGSTYLVMGDVTSGYAEEIHITESTTAHAYELEKWVTTPTQTEINAHAVLDTQPANGIATNGTMFVAVGDNGSFTTTADATTWAYTSPGAARLHAIASSGTYYVAGGEGGEMLQSSDGNTWSFVPLPDTDSHIPALSHDVSAMKFGKSHFVAVTGFTGNGTIFTSTDSKGAVWTETLTQTPVSPAMLPPKLLGLDYDGAHGIFMAVGRSDAGANVIVSLDDGGTWTVTAGDAIVSGADLQTSTAILTSVAYDSTDGCFVAVGTGKGTNSIALKGMVGGTAPNYTITWTKFGSPFSDAGSLPNNVIPTAIAWSPKQNVFVVSGGVETDTGETVVSNVGATTAAWVDENNNLPAGIDHVLGLAYSSSDDTFIGLGRGSLVMTRPAAAPPAAWTLQNTGAQKGDGPYAGEKDDVFFGALALPGSTYIVGSFVETSDTISKIMHLQSGMTPVTLQEFSVE